MSAPHPLVAQLIEERKRLQVKQAELARCIGYSASTVQWWENGRSVPNLDGLTDYAAALGFTVTLQPVTEGTEAA